MALLSIRLRYVDWRDGKPMFKPAGRLYRTLGVKAQALRHYNPDASPGAWFTLAECEIFVKEKMAAMEALRAKRPLAPPSLRKDGVPGSRKKFLYSVDDLFRDFFAFYAQPQNSGELAVSTLRDYRGKHRVLQDFDPELVGCAAEALDKPILFDLYERLRVKGVSQSRGIMVVLSAALTWGILRGKVKFAGDANPAQRLKMRSPKPRVRVGEPAEMRALVAAADAIGRPEIGDAIMLGLWTGQRQSDRLALVDDGLVNGRRIFRQSKTGAIVAILEAPELAGRLTAARERRKDWRVADIEPLIVMDEKARAEFRSDWYRHVFAEVREAAALDSPSLATFRDQDLRDTAVTWMALATSTVPEIIAVTGHTPGQASDILRHYLGRHPELADAAIGKMAAWYQKGAGA